MPQLSVASWGGPDWPFQLAGRDAIRHRAGLNPEHDRLWDYAGGHLGFYGWLRVVNRRIERVTTVSLLDLPDRLWRDEYDDRVPPGEAADIALEEAAPGFGIDPP